MRQPHDGYWWMLVVVSLLIVVLWPPREDKSLAAKFVNWVVDPWGELPMLPPQLGLGQGDDPDAVDARDREVQQYDALYLRGGWTRRRLELKAAGDPFNPATERQILTAAGVLAALVAWKASGRKV